jgi:predicted MFS family arabinose efflux permease
MRHGSAISIALCAMLTLAVAVGIGRFAFTPLLPIMQAETGLTLAAGGWLASANYIGYFLGAVSAVWLSLAPGTVVRGSLLIIAGATAAMGMLHGQLAWLVLRGIAGVASAWALISASAWCLPQLAAMQAASLGGIVFAGVGFGIAVTGLLCFAFLHLSWSYAQAWIALGAVASLLTLAIWPGYRGRAEVQQAMAASPAPASPQLVAAPAADRVRLIACYGVFGFGYIVPATFLPAMARQAIPDPAVFAWAWPIFGLAAFFSTLATAFLGRRLPYRRIWAGGHVVMAIGVALPMLSSNITAILISALCVGGTFMVATLFGMQEARRVAPDSPAALMANMTAAFAFGQILGPALVAVLPAGAAALKALLGAAAALLLLSALELFRSAAAPRA